MEYTFSEPQKAAYEQQGFLIVRDVLPADETLALQLASGRQCAGIVHGKGIASSQI